jgi:hypothetical protein
MTPTPSGSDSKSWSTAIAKFRFVEELTKSILESSLLREEAAHYVLERPLPALAIPTSLH